MRSTLAGVGSKTVNGDDREDGGDLQPVRFQPIGFAGSGDGARVAVYDFGGPVGAPPLLLAHATGFPARTWLPVVAGLRDRFRCYAFDERAHGDSPGPPPEAGPQWFDWHRFADDALAVVDHLGLDAPFAVGHSCGGALLLLAEMARPGTFRSIYCFEPVVPPIDDPPTEPVGSPLADGARRRREEFDSFDAALANFAAKPPMSGFAPEALEAYVRYGFKPVYAGASDAHAGDEARAGKRGAEPCAGPSGETGSGDPGADEPGAEAGAGEPDAEPSAGEPGAEPRAGEPGAAEPGAEPGAGVGAPTCVRLKCRGEYEARTYEAAVMHGAYRRLAEVGCPVTLACGELTTAFGEDVMRLAAARLPHARVEVLPGLTHFGPFEAPAALTARILHAFTL